MPTLTGCTAILLALLLSCCSKSQADVIGFDIQLSLTGFTASQEAIFEAAATTWESYIYGYQDNLSDTTVQITGTSTAIDGAGGTLGSAGPTSAKRLIGGNFLYTETGSMSFDSADVAALEASGLLSDVILHEMAHVLGIGTLWSSAGIGLPGYQELYVSGTGQYTGAAALSACQTEFNQPSATFVPVEIGGGAGTANGHWDEVDGGASPTGIVSIFNGQDFQNELMTGWIGSSTFISTVTLGGFTDLGYLVNTVPEPGPIMFCSLIAVAATVRTMRRRSRR